MTELIPPLAILSLCQWAHQRVAEIEAELAEPLKPIPGQRRIAELVARHEVAVQAFRGLEPILALADELGEDGAGPLPDALYTDQADHIRAVAAEHVALARTRLEMRAKAWPDASRSLGDLRLSAAIPDEQIADARFVTLLAGGASE